MLNSTGLKTRTEGNVATVRGQFSELVRREILGKSWELIQHQLDIFWKRWLVEYLPVIRRQQKWFDETRSLEAGDLVMVAEPAKRNGWERGRIIRKIPNPDGRHRQALVRIGTKAVVRPMSRLALIDVQQLREVPETSGLHRGETVGAEDGKLATLSPAVSTAARQAVKASLQGKRQMSDLSKKRFRRSFHIVD